MLVARAAEARDVLPDALRERGAEVDVVALYETVARSRIPRRSRRRPTADYVTFTSSSTVRNLLEAVGEAFPRGARVVSIGPVTARPRARPGLEVHVEAERHDPAGLVEALVADATAARVSADGRPADHLPLRLRLRRRVRRRLPGGDRADRPRRAGDRPHPRDPPPRRRRGRCGAGERPPYTPGGGAPCGGRSRGRLDRAGRSRCASTDDERVLVGPDNGLLCAGDRAARWGGRGGRPSSSRRFGCEPISATFHGRDVFAPVAAHLALGRQAVGAGEPIDPGALVGAGAGASPRSSSTAASSPTSSTSTASATPRSTSPTSGLPETGLRLGRRVWVGGGPDHARRRLQPHLRRRLARAADPLRGLLPQPRPGGQPRQRRPTCSTSRRGPR